MILLSETRRKIKFNPSYCFFLIAFFIHTKVYSQNPTDNCSTNVTALTVGCSCQKINWDIGTNAGTTGACGGTGEDGWGWFTATSTSTTVSYTNSNRDAVLYVYADNGSSCSGLSAATTVPAGGCVNAVNGTGTETLVVTTIIGNRYYVRVVRLSGTSQDMDGEICVFNTTPSPPSNNEPCTAIDLGIPTTTCSYSSYTNCGATASTGRFANPTCANYSGGDVWFKVTIPASGQLTVNSTTGFMTDGGMAIYSAANSLCTDTLIEISCDDNSGSGSMPMLTIAQPPGAVVFIRFWENGNNNNGTFNLCIQDPCGAGSAPANDNPCSATTITPGISCSYSTYNTNCATGTAGIPNPACGNYQGGDVWFKVTVPASGQLILDTDVGNILDGAMALYTAPTCSSAAFTEVYCDDDGSNNGLMPYIAVVQPAGTVLYIRFWDNGNDSKGTFKLCVYDPCPSGAGTPANNLPCNAIFLPFGIYISGNNECSNNTGEPSAPSCFSTGSVNSVWYKFIATSACAKIKTNVGTIANTQVAVYSGTCGSGMTMLSGACNNDVTPCTGGYTYSYSQLDLTGLTTGTTYYIMVDGRGNNVGSFSIIIINGCGSALPPVQGQDCGLPNLICNDTIIVANPGYQAVGNICDYGAPSPCTGGTAGCNNCATSCMCTGERGSVWYTINITGSGDLEFWIVPNDYPASSPETDYDFALYGPNPSCGNLNNPVRCDWDPNGVTGVYGAADNTAPPGYGGNSNAFRQKVIATAGETYLLNISNYTNSTSGFMLVINQGAGTGTIATTVGAGGTVIWTGAVNTNWFDVNNWGGCQIPDCQVNVVIPGFPNNQPLISGQNASCRSMNINIGASLTINPNLQLMVCNDYTNSGSFIAGNNSLVLFRDTCTTCPGGINHNQIMTGNMTNSNKFWNAEVYKPSGFNVTAFQNLDMAGNFLVSGNPSFGGNFNAANQYHKIAGNFTIESTPLLSTYTPGTTLEFNGTAQTYLNRGQLNSVFMNQSGAGTLTLQDHNGTEGWMQISNTGTLTLTYGKIIAATMGNNRVDVFNRTAASVSAGNLNSYVEGALRRYMPNAGGTGSYDFPVGTSLRGYERINFNITSALSNTVDYWTVYFDNTAPATNTGMNVECSATYHAGGLFALNHGFWNIESSPASLGNGIMNVTNYNRSYSNMLGSGWTVMYDNTINNTPADWLLNPYPPSPCIASPVTAVQRNSLSVPALFTGNPVWFGTAQSQTPLPVEILYLEAQSNTSDILLRWATASEKNNKGFELQRTLTPPDNFEKIAWADGNGSVSTISYYEFEDKNVEEGVNYFYRLKQIDFNGKSGYSRIVSGKINGDKYDFKIMPNPYSGSTNIIYKLKENTTVKIEVFNAMGQKIKTLVDGTQKEGSYQYKFSAKQSGYSTGVYDVRLFINGQLITKRILETQ
ncbi:MAG TPA: T9SS type A sorting domain-containing protein [Bacteroidia bacterium]|nr:T9SS type A sorting domain-containing protein [Bacteroidia bacterium]